MNIQKSVTLPPTQPVWRQKFLGYVWIFNLTLLSISIDANTYFFSDMLNRLIGYPVTSVYPTKNISQGWEAFETSQPSPDGTLIAIGGTTKIGDNFVARVVLWDKSSKKIWEITEKDMSRISSIIWSIDQKYLLTSSPYNSKSMIVDVEKHSVIKKISTSTYSLFHPFTQEKGETLKINQENITQLTTIKPLDEWNVKNFDVGFENKPIKYNELEAAYKSDENFQGFEIRKLNVSNQPHTLFQRKDGDKNAQHVEKLRFSPNGKLIAAGYSDGMLITWDVVSGLEKWRAKPLESDIVELEWNTDGTAIATSSFGGCGWGWLRSECVAVTRANRDSHPTQIVWSRRWNISRSLQWTAPDHLLITLNDRALEVNVGL